MRRSPACAAALTALVAAALPVRLAADPTRLVTLTDGVRLLLAPEIGTRVVAITVAIRIPAPATAREGAAGAVVAHALFLGSTNRSPQGIAASVAQVGGDLEILRTPDAVFITCVTVPDELNEAMYLLCDALKNADFEPSAIRQALRALGEQARAGDRDPYERAYRALGEALGTAPAADPDDLQRIGQDEAAAYFRDHYVPANTVISVVGNFDVARLGREFDDYLFAYDRAPARRAALHASSGAQRPDSTPFDFTVPGHAAYAFVATPGPAVADPDYPAFLVLKALLGSGHASRLFLSLRGRLGLGYTVGAVRRTERDDPLIAYVQWDTQRDAAGAAAAPSPRAVLKLLDAQLDAAMSAPPAAAEMDRARSIAAGRLAIAHERARDRSFFLAWYECLGAGYAFDAMLPARIAAVTGADVLRVARKYLGVRVHALGLPR